MTFWTKAASIIICGTLLVACDPAYPLFVRNGLSQPITVRTAFSGEMQREGVLQSGERMAFMHMSGKLERVTIIVDGATIQDLDATAVASLIASVPDPRQVTWSVQEDGIKPLGRHETQHSGAE